MNANDSAKADLPHVAVLLLNWNAWEITTECLESLFRLDYPRFTVVLCDNDSTDGSTERFRAWARGELTEEPKANAALRHLSSPPVRKPIKMVEYTRAEAEARNVGPTDAPLVLIHNGGNIGYAGGNNVGMRYIDARGDIPYIVILNNDVVVAPDSLREMVQCMLDDPTVGAVGPTMFEYNAPAVVQALGGGAFSRRQLFPALTAKSPNGDGQGKIDWVTGACLLARTDHLVKAGMFDEAYYIYAEDVDLSLSIARLGVRLVHAPRAHIWHRGGGEQGYGNPKHDFYTLRNSLRLIRKYYPGMMPAASLFMLYRGVAPKVVRLQPRRLAAVLRAWRDFRNGVFGKVSI
jgi:GT2 family glycosyltransferase